MNRIRIPGSLFDDAWSDGDHDMFKREIVRRQTEAKAIKSKSCMSCGEKDEEYLVPFISTDGSKNNKNADNGKICRRCINRVCQNCSKSECQLILKQSRGDGLTICVDCVDCVCRKCKLQNRMDDMILRQSQHGRSMCRKCKMAQDFSKSAFINMNVMKQKIGDAHAKNGGKK